MHGVSVRSKNLLLASLPEEAAARVMAKLTPAPLAMRETIYHPGAPMRSVWFPESGMISLVKLLRDGMRTEVGVIGCEGVLGLSVLADAETSFNESVVQLPGMALRMPATEFRAEFETNPPFRGVLLRYYEALQGQVMQTAACNSQHGLEQRLARWLLMALDRADSARLPLTQEFMAMMLGAHRPSVTVTAGILHRAGLISQVNGVVTVLDRAALEAAACECYATVRRRSDSLLGSGDR